MKRILLYIIAAQCLALVVVVFFRQKTEEDPQPVFKIVKQEVHDTIYIPVSSPVETVFVPVPADVDTADILQQYYAYNMYIDTIKVNDYIEIAFTDTIYNNKLLSHNMEVLSLPQVVVNPNAITTSSIALGGLIGTKMAALKADYSYRRHNFSVGFDFINKAPLVGYSYKIKSW